MTFEDRPPGGVFKDPALTSITAGGTAQVVFNDNLDRRYFLFQNTSDTDMWLGIGATNAAAASPAIKIPAGGGYYEPYVPPLQRITVFCASTGKTFSAKEA